MKKGQGTIEYLVILAIIVVIALVVVTILSQFTSQGAGMNKNRADSAWASATPIGITSSVKKSTGEVTLVVKNNSPNPITLRDVNLSSTDRNSVNIQLSTGNQATIKINSTNTCTPGSYYTYSASGIAISYIGDLNGTYIQTAPTDLILNCSQ